MAPSAARPAPAAAAAAKVAGPVPARWSAVSTPDPVGSPRLLLVAHGSSDPRFLTIVESVVAGLRELRPGLGVAAALLEHGPPHVADVATADDIVVPLLLSSGYHVRVDLPRQARDIQVAAAVGPDPLLAAALHDRLIEAGYDGRAPVTLAAAGSTDPRSVADVEIQARLLAGRLGVVVDVGYLAAGSPRLADVLAGHTAHAGTAVASYLLAPGTFADTAAACGAAVVAQPLGAHPAVAEVALRRYDAALPTASSGRAGGLGQVPGRTAPA